MITYAYMSLMVLIIVVANVARLRERYGHDGVVHRQCENYTGLITSALLNEDKLRVVVHTDSEREALVEAMYLVVSHTYGIDFSLLDGAVRENKIDRYVMRNIALSRGVRRARWLLRINAIHPTQKDVDALHAYMHSGDRVVRTSALLAVLSAQPMRAIQTIASLHYRLSSFDVARVVTLLRQGLLPIAYEPLLIAENHNMRMLGLAIVRNFGIDIADRHLQHIIISLSDEALLRETIYTLSSLGRPLGRERVGRRLSMLSQMERRELCRYLCVEGYSISALRMIFTQQEIEFNIPLIKSYKRDLICTQTNY